MHAAAEGSGAPAGQQTVHRESDAEMCSLRCSAARRTEKAAPQYRGLVTTPDPPDFFHSVIWPNRLGTMEVKALVGVDAMDVPESSGTRQKDQLISMRTEHLRDRLNRLYDAVRANARSNNYWCRFDYLWDLKELAVLEGRNAVWIPENWLEELENAYVEIGDFSGRGN